MQDQIYPEEFLKIRRLIILLFAVIGFVMMIGALMHGTDEITTEYQHYPLILRCLLPGLWSCFFSLLIAFGMGVAGYIFVTVIVGRRFHRPNISNFS